MQLTTTTQANQSCSADEIELQYAVQVLFVRNPYTTMLDKLLFNKGMSKDLPPSERWNQYKGPFVSLDEALDAACNGYVWYPERKFRIVGLKAC